MSASRSTRELIRDFILTSLLQGQADAGELDDSTPLLSTGILDSLAVLRLVTYLEDEFAITVAPTEVDEEHLNTVADIAKLVQAKLGDS